MRLTIAFLFLLITFLTTAQQVSIKGTVQDQADKQMLPYATVALLDNENKIILGTTTNDEGIFTLVISNTDKIHLKIQNIGYHSLDTVLTIEKSKTVLSMVFFLKSNSTTLQEVTVSAEKSANTTKMDKQLFNTKQLGNTTSGTGLDVLQRLPSVTINTEGKI